MGEYKSVCINSKGCVLVGRIYCANAQAPTPLLILCHGFCGIQDVLLPSFASAFVKAGYSVITFDYRGFGESEGERGRLQPKMQIDDIHAVIDWAQQQRMIDPSRIGLWGTSLGGCHVAVVARQNPMVKCFISQMPFADGEALVTGAMSAEEKRKLLFSLERMLISKKNSGRELFVSPLKVLNDKDTRHFFDVNKECYPQLGTKIPFLTIQEMIDYKPVQEVVGISQPALIVASELDLVNPPEQARQLYDALDCKKTFVLIKGAGHYDLYEQGFLAEVLKNQVEWLHMHL